MPENPLTNLGELTKPATVLVEKVSDAVGGVFKPFQLRRIAQAEADAEIIREKGRIEVTDLQRRAVHRFLEEEAKKQSNMEAVVQKALPHLTQDSAPQNVDDDWITNFFDKCRIVSDGDMQQLWSRILAGQANAPGAFSRKTVNLLADLDKTDAELFMRLCSFAWTIKDIYPLVFSVDAEIYNHYGITFDTASHLESLGLIQFDNLAGFRLLNIPKKFNVLYFGKRVELTFRKEAENELDVGTMLLTRAGKELARVGKSKPVDGFFDFVYDTWASKGLVPARESAQGAPPTAQPGA